MTVYKKPITMSDIRKITGMNAELGLMISEGYINANSLHKPVRLNTRQALTEEDRKSVNYGYGIIEYNSYASMVQGFNRGDKWKYLRPRGLYFETSTNEPPEPGRMLDFDGYDSEATSPFEMRTEKEPRIGEKLRLLFPIEPKELTTWGMWSYFQGDKMSQLQMGVYVPSIGYYPIVYGNLRLDDDLYNDPDKGFHVPITSAAGFSTGTKYAAYIVLTTWDVSTQKWYEPSLNENDSGHRWWIINVDGTQPLEFTVQGEYNAMDKVSDSMVTNAVTYIDYNEADETFINTSFDYAITMNGAVDGTPYINIDFVVPRVYPGSGTQPSDVTIGHLIKYNFTQGVTATAHINYPDKLRFLTASKEQDLKIEARIRLVRPTANAGNELLGQRIDLITIYANN